MGAAERRLRPRCILLAEAAQQGARQAGRDADRAMLFQPGERPGPGRRQGRGRHAPGQRGDHLRRLRQGQGGGGEAAVHRFRVVPLQQPGQRGRHRREALQLQRRQQRLFGLHRAQPRQPRAARADCAGLIAPGESHDPQRPVRHVRPAALGPPVLRRPSAPAHPEHRCAGRARRAVPAVPIVQSGICGPSRMSYYTGRYVVLARRDLEPRAALGRRGDAGLAPARSRPHAGAGRQDPCAARCATAWSG